MLRSISTHLFHALDRDVLVWAVEGVAAGAQIWAGQALPGQYGPVGAAACHAHKGLYTGLLRASFAFSMSPAWSGKILSSMFR